jgi:outer membrane murein-binding lipoprotein Lpp
MEVTMRKLTLLLVVIFFVLSTIALAGCSSKPIDELKMARVAMDEARRNEASIYAPLDWDRARMNWEEANNLIQIGRNSEAKDILVLAVGNFNTARDTAARRLESLKVEVTALQNNAKTELNTLEQAGESAKVKPSVKKRIDGALPLIEEKIAVMNAALEEKDYLRARTAGTEASRWMEELQESVATPR